MVHSRKNNSNISIVGMYIFVNKRVSPACKMVKPSSVFCNFTDFRPRLMKFFEELTQKLRTKSPKQALPIDNVQVIIINGGFFFDWVSKP